MPFGTGTKGGAFTAGQQAFMPAMLGQSMADMQMIENRAAKDDDDDDDEDKETRPPMPNPMVRSYNPNPYAGSPGEGLYFQYQRRPRADGSTPKYPYYYSEGGQLGAALPLVGGYEGRQIAQFRKRDLDMLNRQINPTPADVFGNLSRGIKSIVSNNVESKVNPFIQRVEKDASQTFPEIFSQASTYGLPQPARVFTRSPIVPAAQPSSLASPNSSKGSAKSRPQLPFYASLIEAGRRYSEGGEVEVDEMMEDNGMNEKDVIVEAIKAIKEMSDQPEIALAMFVQKYGEEALRDLVGRVQSGELDDTVLVLQKVIKEW